MKIANHKIDFVKTAHYYTLGLLSPSTEYIWIACHGYGQAADRFIKKFDQIDLNRHFIIAPEGLSRFYWGGFTGEVVASWMTSKDRLDEIENYTRFLHTIYQDYAQKYPKITWMFFGFSQGSATILRYLDQHQPRCEKLIIWAGEFPPDLNYERCRNYLNGLQVEYFYGDEDAFLTEARWQKENTHIEQQKLAVNFHNFKGGHQVKKEVLTRYILDNYP